MSKLVYFIFLALIALVPVLSRAQTPSTSPITLTRPLYIGVKGDDVSYLQTFLKAKGFFSYPTITGFFGSFTWQAVADFQSANNLERVGVVGPLTRGLINGSSNTLSSTSSTQQSPLASSTTIIPPLSILPGVAATYCPFAFCPTGDYTPGFGGGGGPVGDIVAPSLSAIVAAPMTTTTIRVTWNTDEVSDSYVEYGTTNSYGSATSSSALSTSHALVISDLTYGTTYYFRVRSTDAAGNAATATGSSFVNSLAGYKVVGTRGGIQWQTTAISGSDKTIEGRSRQRLEGTPTGVRFLFSNKYMNTNSPYNEVSNNTDIPLTAALEWDSPSTYVQAFQNGGNIVVPAGADYLVTDEMLPSSLSLGTAFPAFGVYWERVSSVLASGTWLQGGKASRIPSANTTGEFGIRHNPPAVQALGTGALTAYGGSGQRAYLPVAVIAKIDDPNYKALLAVGDSWVQGSADADDTVEGGFGYVQQASKWDGVRAIATLNLARGGDSAVDFLSNSSYRMKLAPLATHAIIGYGFNDFSHYARSGAQVVADLKTISAQLKAAGIQKVAVANLAPYTTGTFTATSTQTSQSGWETFRQAVNSGLVVGPDFDAVLDISTVVSDPDFPTKWRANYTSDGIHPLPIGHSAIATSTKAILSAWGF